MAVDERRDDEPDGEAPADVHGERRPREHGVAATLDERVDPVAREDAEGAEERDADDDGHGRFLPVGRSHQPETAVEGAPHRLNSSRSLPRGGPGREEIEVPMTDVSRPGRGKPRDGGTRPRLAVRLPDELLAARPPDVTATSTTASPTPGRRHQLLARRVRESRRAVDASCVSVAELTAWLTPAPPGHGDDVASRVPAGHAHERVDGHRDAVGGEADGGSARPGSTAA